MGDIVRLERSRSGSEPPKKPPTLRDRFGRDDWALEMCAEWRAARAQQEKNWAEHELKTGWGSLPSEGHELDLGPLDRVQELESCLAICEPHTMLCARELLRMCATILAHRAVDPEAYFSQGPILEIVLNVIKSLEALDYDAPFGDAVREKRKRRKRRNGAAS